MTKLRLREQHEIEKRLKDIRAERISDFFGFRKQVLLPVIDFETAKQFLRDGVTKEDWNKPMSGPQIEKAAREYYQFALTKIRDHRGLSASRSVEKLEEFAWLLGRDDVVEAMEDAPFPQYGAPKVRKWAEGFEERWPAEKVLVLMSQGRHCTWGGCDMGCGS